MKFWKNKQTIYEIGMVFLAAFSIATIWNKTTYDSYIVWTTWAIFFIDFLVRLFKSENKWQFVKKNPYLVIAAIPLDALFQLARFARILHLLRLKTITKYYTMPLIHFLKKQSILAVISAVIVITFVLIVPIYHLEPEITSYSEAMVKSLKTLTFFGRSDIEPTTVYSHIVVVVLTIIGVVLHGLIISTTIDTLSKSERLKDWKERFKRKKVDEEQ